MNNETSELYQGVYRASNLLYLTDEQNEYANVLAAIDGFAEGIGQSHLNVDLSVIENILREMRNEFPAQGGSEMASPFKKAANFLCFFVSEAPVKNPFPESIVGSEIAQIRNHQNAMVGLHIAFDALHEATIFRADGEVTLKNRISLSKHSYIDMIQACANLSPASHFHLVSVFLEQMCYRVNPEASYPLNI